MNKFLAQTRQNILAQQEAIRDNRLQDAQLINDLVVPDELPQTNTQVINEIEIQFLESGQDINIIRNNYSTILPISLQCPYAGGAAVIKARTFIAMVNDSAVYNDDDICLQSGVYRIPSDTIVNDVILQQSIQIIPNPANDKITIIHSGITEGLCKVKIENSLAQIVLTETFNCKKQQHTINTSQLTPGVYSVKVDFENAKSKIIKLVIQR